MLLYLEIMPYLCRRSWRRSGSIPTLGGLYLHSPNHLSKAGPVKLEALYVRELMYKQNTQASQQTRMNKFSCTKNSFDDSINLLIKQSRYVSSKLSNPHFRGRLKRTPKHSNRNMKPQSFSAGKNSIQILNQAMIWSNIYPSNIFQKTHVLLANFIQHLGHNCPFSTVIFNHCFFNSDVPRMVHQVCCGRVIN